MTGYWATVVTVVGVLLAVAYFPDRRWWRMTLLGGTHNHPEDDTGLAPTECSGCDEERLWREERL